MNRRLTMIFCVALAAGCGEVSSALDASLDSGARDATIDAGTGDDAPTDAEIDAAIDAPFLSTPFTIVYASRWDLAYVSGAQRLGVGLVVNGDPIAASSLNLGVLTVESAHANGADFTFRIDHPSDFELAHGFAAGWVDPEVEPFLTGSAPEPRADTTRPSFAFTLTSIPPVNTTIYAQAVLRHGSQRAVLGFEFVIRSAGPPSLGPTGSARVISSSSP
jgi:hypothetical protein